MAEIFAIVFLAVLILLVCVMLYVLLEESIFVWRLKRKYKVRKPARSMSDLEVSKAFRGLPLA